MEPFLFEDFSITRHQAFGTIRYQVVANLDTKEITCSCIGFQMSKEPKHCKHTVAFKEKLEKELQTTTP